MHKSKIHGMPHVEPSDDILSAYWNKCLIRYDTISYVGDEVINSQNIRCIVIWCIQSRMCKIHSIQIFDKGKHMNIRHLTMQWI